MENKRVSTRYCLVCVQEATIEYYGYYFCHSHKWFTNCSPEELEMIVLLRFEGKTSNQIENHYKRWKSNE